jgi:hypothetical protein
MSSYGWSSISIAAGSRTHNKTLPPQKKILCGGGRHPAASFYLFSCLKKFKRYSASIGDRSNFKQASSMSFDDLAPGLYFRSSEIHLTAFLKSSPSGCTVVMAGTPLSVVGCLLSVVLAAGHWLFVAGRLLLAPGCWFLLNVARIGSASRQLPEASSQTYKLGFFL